MQKDLSALILAASIERKFSVSLEKVRKKSGFCGKKTALDATEPLNIKTLRRLFHDWDSLKLLGEHPLCHMRIVKARSQMSGRAQSSLGQALALREVILQALEALKPSTGQP